MLRRFKKILVWTGAITVVGAVGYGIFLTAGVPYNDTDLVAVDFSGLSRQAKRTALQAANRARCTCGCGMTLAQCVATDSTCPLRTGNIDRIRTMVKQAVEPRTSS